VGSDFEALLDGERVHVQTVLERTVVYWSVGTAGEKQLAAISRVQVDVARTPVVAPRESVRDRAARRGRSRSAETLVARGGHLAGRPSSSYSNFNQKG